MIFFSSQKRKLGYIIQNQFSYLKLGSTCHWKISLEVHFCEIHGAVETKLMEHLTMPCSDKYRWREINPFPSLWRITIFYSSLCDFSSTAITSKRLGLCIVIAGRPILGKEIAFQVFPRFLWSLFGTWKENRRVKGDYITLWSTVWRHTFFCLPHTAILHNTVWMGTVHNSGGTEQLCTVVYVCTQYEPKYRPTHFKCSSLSSFNIVTVLN